MRPARVTPTLAFVAPPAVRDDTEIRDAVIRLTYPLNALGWPALSLPCGRAENGLPASIQLAAPLGEDARLIAAGALLERERGRTTATSRMRSRARPAARVQSHSRRPTPESVRTARRPAG